MRTQHVHIIGPTKSGKTTLIKNMVIQDLNNGIGLAVIDPKGDLCWEVIEFLPCDRFDDVIVFDPTDTDRPVGFNVLEAVPSKQRSLAASTVVSIFKKLFADSWGPRLEHILRFAVLTLLEVPGATLIDIPSLLVRKEYRQRVLKYVTNPMVRMFWEGEFREITKGRKYIDMVEPILNKVGPWLAYPEIRNIVGQRKSSFNIRDIMDNRKILLCNLPKGQLGEDTSGMLGAMIVARIQLAAMSRTGRVKNKLFACYVDEFHNFVSSAFETILCEARSFGLGLVVAHQGEYQLYEKLIWALKKNVGVRLTCTFENRQQGLIYHEIQDQAALPITVKPSSPPTGGHPDLPKYVWFDKRQIYGRRREAVERDILSRWQSSEEEEGPVY